MVHRFKSGDIRDDQRPKAVQEGRNGRNESKKIMKKSASIKLSDGGDTKGIESMKIELSDVNDLISLPHMGNPAQPGNSKAAKVSNVLPNFMKPTSSSGAKKDSNRASVLSGAKSTSFGQNQAESNLKNSKHDTSGRCLVKTSSLKLMRNLTKSLSFKQSGSMKKSIQNGAVRSDRSAQRATCSSLLKDSKFPSFVTLDPGASESRGSSSMNVCTCKYCSLNGHHHAIVQPLKSFISARRRSLKKQKSLKPEDATREVPFFEENETEEGVDICVHIYENDNGLGKATVGLANNLVATRFDAESEEDLYESIWEAYEKELQEFAYAEARLDEDVYVRIENEAEFDCIRESSNKGPVTVADDAVNKLFEDELDACSHEDNLRCQTGEELEETLSDTEDLVDKIVAAAEENQKENECELLENLVSEMDRESIELDQIVFVYTMATAESEIGTSDLKSTKCKAVEEDLDGGKDFNPQEPNYLPLEPEKKAEKVDLKHQDIDERKNSEEWMVDYALRKTVSKLAPVKRQKVELLVEAFESVAPVSKLDHRARRASFPFANGRTIQACN